MAANRQQSGSIVLHLRPIRAFGLREENACQQIDNKLQQANINVEFCTDVYRALARLSKDGKFDNSTVLRYQAVVVCVDSLNTTEFEFFSIIAKHSRKTPVFIYSQTDRADQLAAGTAAGATGIFNNDVISMLADDNLVGSAQTNMQAHKPDKQAQALVSQPALEPKIANESTESPILTLHNNESEDSPRDAFIDEISEEELAGPIQVPWEKHREGPVRVPPTRSDDEVTVASIEESPAPKEVANEPLLTQDELRALLDEDVSSWPPADWDDPDSASSNSGAELA